MLFVKKECFLIIDKKHFRKSTKILNGEQDFNPINPQDDGCFYHLNTLEKFLDGTLEFDEQPTEIELTEISLIVELMKVNDTLFLYLK